MPPTARSESMRCWTRRKTSARLRRPESGLRGMYPESNAAGRAGRVLGMQKCCEDGR